MRAGQKRPRVVIDASDPGETGCGDCQHWTPRKEDGDYGRCSMLAVIHKRGGQVSERAIYPERTEGTLIYGVVERERKATGEYRIRWEEAGRVVGVEDAWHWPQKDPMTGDRLWSPLPCRAPFSCNRFAERVKKITGNITTANGVQMFLFGDDAA